MNLTPMDVLATRIVCEVFQLDPLPHPEKLTFAGLVQIARHIRGQCPASFAHGRVPTLVLDSQQRDDLKAEDATVSAGAMKIMDRIRRGDAVVGFKIVVPEESR